MSDLRLDVDQASELKAAFRRSNWTNAEIKKLCEGALLYDVRTVLHGAAEIHLRSIDLDAPPLAPRGLPCYVHKHIKGGQFQWDIHKVKLHATEAQAAGENVPGRKMMAQLDGLPVFNANLLDHLLKFPILIPEDWSSHGVVFWGTIYGDDHDALFVRGLGCYCYQWGDYTIPLGEDIYHTSHAAIRLF